MAHEFLNLPSASSACVSKEVPVLPVNSRDSLRETTHSQPLAISPTDGPFVLLLNQHNTAKPTITFCILNNSSVRLYATLILVCLQFCPDLSRGFHLQFKSNSMATLQFYKQSLYPYPCISIYRICGLYQVLQMSFLQKDILLNVDKDFPYKMGSNNTDLVLWAGHRVV